MPGLRGDSLTILLFLIGAAVSSALAAFTLTGPKAGALWIAALICLAGAAIYAVRGRMVFKNNNINIQHLGKVGTAVKIDLGPGGDFSENDMKVRVAEAEKLLEVSGDGNVQRNKFDLAAEKIGKDDSEV